MKSERVTWKHVLNSYRHKKKLIARVFATSKNWVQPIKTAVKVESGLAAVYKDRLQIDEFPIPDPLKIPHG